MIETTIRTIEGVQFIENIRILESDDKLHGVPVHRINSRVLENDELMRTIKAKGLREVGYDCERDEALYAQFPVNFFKAIILNTLFAEYWAIVRWLYDNARVFKQIPPGTMFSWRYFTPYCWCLKLRGKNGR